MKAPTIKFSTLRGILWIAAFFLLLFLYPLLTTKRTVQFSSSDSEGISNPVFFPLNVKLTVYRDLTRASRTKVTLGELLKESPGGPTLINFWATWCPPCLEELPSIELFNKQINASKTNMGNKIPRLITISVDDRLEDISKLESTLDFKPSFSVMYDREGELARSMGTTKFPETYLVNSEGKILYKWLGPQDWLSFDVLRQLKSHVQ